MSKKERVTDTSQTSIDQPPHKIKAWWKKLSGLQRGLAIGLVVFITLGVLGSSLKYLENYRAAKIHSPKNTAINSIVTRSNITEANPAPPELQTSTTFNVAKDYVYSGSRLVAVEEQGNSMQPPSDLTVWRPSSGVWYVMGSADGVLQAAAAWGMAGDVPIPGDYDGDGKTDFAIYRPATTPSQPAYWYILKSSDNSFNAYPFGTMSDVPVPSDYDGDGQVETAIWRPSDANWHIIASSTQQYYLQQFGTSTDKPVPADYDGDGKSDLTLWRQDTLTWYIWQTSNNTWRVEQFGNATDIVVSGDYDGDGKFDLAMWQQDNFWKIKQSSSGIVRSVQWGLAASDKPVPGDYDGDGKTDVAIWRPSTGGWWIEQSKYNYQLRYSQWGMDGDIPVPAPYRR